MSIAGTGPFAPGDFINGRSDRIGTDIHGEPDFDNWNDRKAEQLRRLLNENADALVARIEGEHRKRIIADHPTATANTQLHMLLGAMRYELKKAFLDRGKAERERDAALAKVEVLNRKLDLALAHFDARRDVDVIEAIERIK